MALPEAAKRERETASQLYAFHAGIPLLIAAAVLGALVVRSSSAEGRGPGKIALTHRGMKLAEKIPVVPQNVLQKGLREIPKEQLESTSEGLESLANLLDPQRKVPLLFFSPIPEAPEARPAG